MVLAIVRKELRETRLFAALAAGVYLIYLSGLTGKWGRPLQALVSWVPGLNVEATDIPFVQDNFVSMLFFIGVPLAITLGFRQSAWEPSQGTALYLLHLPLGRRIIFLTKLSTGIGLLLVSTLLPIVLYATWAATPGTHPGPFEWSMTGPAFQMWLLMPLAYLGAFASGIRQARWFGTRLLPLLAVTVPAILVFAVSQWWLIGFPLLLLVAAVFLSDILWEAETRDF
jgi:ABC-type transport system involved in multi-copper enzyme maturation permease subunit